MSNNKQQPKPENPNNQFSNTEPLTHAQRVAIANTMSNNKQSSVEWLVQELRKFYAEPWKYDKQIIIEQAKAMHRKEHGKTWDDSLDNLKARGMNEMRAYADFDEYYNETFNQETK